MLFKNLLYGTFLKIQIFVLLSSQPISKHTNNIAIMWNDFFFEKVDFETKILSRIPPKSSKERCKLISFVYWMWIQKSLNKHIHIDI